MTTPLYLDEKDIATGLKKLVQKQNFISIPGSGYEFNGKDGFLFELGGFTGFIMSE